MRAGYEQYFLEYMDQDEDKQYDDTAEDELDGFHTDDEEDADDPSAASAPYEEEGL
jgi:hypothetical protein